MATARSAWRGAGDTLYHSKRFWFVVGKIDTEFGGVRSKIAYQVVCDDSWSLTLI